MTGRLLDYLAAGVIASRPAAPVLQTGGLGCWFSTDTLAFSVWDGAAWNAVGGGGGSGDVVGPASSTDNRLALFDGVTGKLLKESSMLISALAVLASPAFTGTPTAPTAAPGTNNTQISTTAYADAIAALKANLASPTFTGTPAGPTAAPGTNTTQLATTAYADAGLALKANIASPTFTGTPAAPTPAAADNTTKIATTAFVQGELVAKAPLASPTFTGNHTVSQANLETGSISPAALAANTNDWAPAGFADVSVVRASMSATHALTGLAGGADGRCITIANVGTFDIWLTNEDAGSSAANRFLFGRAVILQPNRSMQLRYDGTSSRWRCRHALPRAITVLAADVTNNNAVADTLQDVTGLSIDVLSGRLIRAHFYAVYTSAATTTGSRWSLLGPSITNMQARGAWSANANTNQSLSAMTANTWDTGAVVSITSYSTSNGNWAYYDMVLNPSADGSVVMRFSSEVSGSAIVAKAGLSYVEYEPIA